MWRPAIQDDRTRDVHPSSKTVPGGAVLHIAISVKAVILVIVSHHCYWWRHPMRQGHRLQRWNAPWWKTHCKWHLRRLCYHSLWWQQQNSRSRRPARYCYHHYLRRWQPFLSRCSSPGSDGWLQLQQQAFWTWGNLLGYSSPAHFHCNVSHKEQAEFSRRFQLLLWAVSCKSDWPSELNKQSAVLSRLCILPKVPTDRFSLEPPVEWKLSEHNQEIGGGGG